MENRKNWHPSSIDAAARGFKTFNPAYRHVCVDVPDEGMTVSARMTDGKRVTFNFFPSAASGDAPAAGGPIECVDIDMDGHDAAYELSDGRHLYRLHLVGFSAGTRSFDTRNEG
ncbi:MAG: hypothetical protein ACREQ5_11460, partial [Candidatus Dormibacteria bacterium]